LWDSPPPPRLPQRPLPLSILFVRFLFRRIQIFCGILSILFVRFLSIPHRVIIFPLTFNSLCEIQSHDVNDESPPLSSFNSLCEIPKLTTPLAPKRYSFNSLCEILVSQTPITVPLTTFNSLCEILDWDCLLYWHLR